MNNNTFNDFEKVLRCKDNVSSTIQRKLCQLNGFLFWVKEQGKEIADFQPNDIREYLVKRFKRRPARIQNLQVVTEYLDFCIERKLVTENVAAKIEFIREPTQRIYDIPSFKEIELITERIKRTDSMSALRDFIMVELAYGSGARAGEISSLNVEDFYPGEKKVLLKGKGRGAKKERYVPLTDIGCKAIQEYIKKRKVVNGAMFVSHSGKRMSNSSIYYRFEKWSGRNPHAFRHAFASDLLLNGCDFESISKMLGHSRPSTTAIYTHIPIEKIQEKVNAFHPRNAPFPFPKKEDL